MNTLAGTPCACGCNELVTPDSRGRPRRFVYGHHNRLQPNKRVQLTCDFCGKAIVRAQWQLRRETGHNFCDATCAGQWATANGTKRGSNNGHYRSITVPCSGCDAPVTKAQSLVNRRNGRVYCPDCIPELRAAHMRAGVVNPPEFSKALRKSIRERDGFACQRCGDHQNTGRTLHVHHIDYDRMNNVPMNLISLCPVCHMRSNFGMKHWQAFYESMMQERFS